MFPNPQDALPLPSRPSLEQYKKLAKDLVKTAASSDRSALRTWAVNWLKNLVQLANLQATDRLPINAGQLPAEFESFVRKQESDGKLSLSKAQFVLARSHGFESWPKFSRHLDALAHADSSEADFEKAADVIVGGQLDDLTRLLRKNPDLVRARSTREHRGTLLHYVAANGIEGYRQKTPGNVVQIARLLLDSGAEVDAEADVYGGGSTTLELAATSVHPERAGVQEALMQLLIDRGATEKPAASHGRTLVSVCLANGRKRAAEFLAARGFRIDLEAAAGLGRLDLVTKLFADATKKQRESALCWACEHGSIDSVHFLLDQAVSIHPIVSGETALHWAVVGGHIDIIHLLLSHGADLEAKNVYGGTALGQAVWCVMNTESDDEYLKVIEALIEAGAVIDSHMREWLAAQAKKRESIS